MTQIENLRRRVLKCRYGDEPPEGLKPPHPTLDRRPDVDETKSHQTAGYGHLQQTIQFMKHTPIESHLARAGRRADLRRRRDYAAPPTPGYHSDNLPNGFGADLVLEVRPSPDELLRRDIQHAIAGRPCAPVSPADIDRGTRQRISFKDGRVLINGSAVTGVGILGSRTIGTSVANVAVRKLNSRRTGPAIWRCLPQANFRVPPTKPLEGRAAIMRSPTGLGSAGSAASTSPVPTPAYTRRVGRRATWLALRVACSLCRNACARVAPPVLPAVLRTPFSPACIRPCCCYAWRSPRCVGALAGRRHRT